MAIVLDQVEVRVLGSLVEKAITTPDYYPLSLNALINACNQKSNRDPLMTLAEDAVRGALRSLKEKELAGPADTTDSRVTKYEHRLQEVYNFDRRETAILCELLLRGPQTPGELHSRAERMHPFDDLREVQSTLQRLMNREPPLIMLLPRWSGIKEPRYSHLLSGVVEPSQAKSPGEETITRRVTDGERLTRLEGDVVALQSEVAELKQQLADFRKQFE